MNPDPNQSFPGKQADEKVLAFTRRHWFFFLPDSVFFLLLLVLPVAVLLIMSALDGAPFDEPARSVTVIALPLWYLAAATWFFIRWLDYYLDLAIVTDQRVIDIDQFGMFRRRFSELNHEVIQDVTVAQNGIFATLLNFGTVEVQTAGEQENFRFGTIPHPAKIANTMNELHAAGGEQEEEAAEKMEEAAEKMADAAEKISHAAPITGDDQQPTAETDTATAAPSGASDGESQSAKHGAGTSQPDDQTTEAPMPVDDTQRDENTGSPNQPGADNRTEEQKSSPPPPPPDAAPAAPVSQEAVAAPAEPAAAEAEATGDLPQEYER